MVIFILNKEGKVAVHVIDSLKLFEVGPASRSSILPPCACDKAALRRAFSKLFPLLPGPSIVTTFQPQNLSRDSSMHLPWSSRSFPTRTGQHMQFYRTPGDTR
jgi:hypothetical protein